MPATLLAQTDAPTPLPQIATPRCTLSGNHGLGERHDEVGIVVLRIQRVCAEIHDLVARGAQVRDEFLFQAEPAVIRGDAHTHIRSFNTRRRSLEV